MTKSHWFWLFCLVSNGIGAYMAWSYDRHPSVLLFIYSVGYSMSRLIYMDYPPKKRSAKRAEGSEVQR